MDVLGYAYEVVIASDGDPYDARSMHDARCRLNELGAQGYRIIDHHVIGPYEGGTRIFHRRLYWTLERAGSLKTPDGGRLVMRDLREEA